MLQIFKTFDELAQGVAGYIFSAIGQTLSAQDRFSLVLSGGSTPRAAYTLLSEPAIARQVDWARVHIFWGDERCVPPDHNESNFRMARETLLSRLPFPERNIHRIQGELPPQQAAEAYLQQLEGFFGGQSGLPHFDLVLLGMGEDGHVASLFPGDAALEVVDRWVVAVEHDRPPAPLVARVTVTLPVINAARRVALIVSGSGKAERVRQALSGADAAETLPAQRVKPKQGELVWLLDGDAGKWINPI